MKIAQLTTGREINGAVRHCYDLSNELAARGHEVTLIHRPDAWIASQSYHPNVSLFSSPIKRNVRTLNEVASHLKQIGCDVVHTHLSGASFFGVLLARLFRFTSVATCHMPHFQPHWWWNDRVIVPCQSVMTYQRRVNWVPRRRIDVIANFIDPKRMQCNEGKESVRKSLGLPATAFVVGTVGTLDKRKGFQYLLPVVSRMFEMGIDFHALSMGPQEPEYASFIRSEMDRLRIADRVHLLGMRNDVPRLLKGMDCVCLPSLKEVMPISLLEAMATGLPAVATNVGGVKDCVRHGLDGWVVPPQNSDALFAALYRWTQDGAELATMGSNAKRSMQESFTPDALVPRIEQTYKKACSL
jgi:L-malate glycosyltransferase